ncbi:hypothetical protein JCR33_18015 [Acuticoccus sp. 2012]|uniref:Sulfotransferase family protein n=1 Tax=Acuticoccus mangrovi TaxID=2796142 RepID=A0A934IRV4_9HYPH|nr:hypothetical protein [Acuticoccus mangrovi]
MNYEMIRHFGAARVLSGQPPLALGRLAAMTLDERNAAYDAVAGHFAWNVTEYFENRPFTAFSILRDPLERICSFFNFVHRSTSHPANAIFKKRLKSLNDLTEALMRPHPIFFKEWSNYYTRAFSGLSIDRFVDGDSAKGVLGPAGFGATFDEARSLVEERIADRRLIIGEQPLIEAFLRDKGVLEGSLTHRNVAPKVDPAQSDYEVATVATLSPATRALLLEWNALDMALLGAVAPDSVRHRGVAVVGGGASPSA